MPVSTTVPTRQEGGPEAAFAALQACLRPFESTEDATRAEERTVLAIPSINLDQDLLDRHAQDLPALEERCLYLAFALRRPRVRLVVVTCLPVPSEVVDYYLGLVAVEDASARIHLLSPEDDSPRPLAQKILERPDLLARLRELVSDRRGAFIMPFNVRDHERDLALELDVPIYGVDHRFARHGIKSGCRHLFESAGVSHPPGARGLRSAAELAEALMALRQARPGLEAAVVKLDDAVYGEGNLVINLRDLPRSGTPAEAAAIDVRLRSLPSSYVEKLSEGGVVEELVAGEIRSPSVQMRILPGGKPVVVSTHDQVLGGALSQTFVACRFPADGEYAAAIIHEARKVGTYLGAEGVVGRFGIDFVVARRDGGWVSYAVEINLREGGTSHPYGALWLLTDGSLDKDKTTFRTPSGQAKYYFATDRLGDATYRGIRLSDFLSAAAASGLTWNPRSQTGPVYHMLRALEQHGRIGVTAIGDSPDQAHEIYLGAAELLDRLAATRTERA
jgi:pre ATP-grasp domain-containing protein/pheganomycin biosynthesis PGM1-like protein